MNETYAAVISYLRMYSIMVNQKFDELEPRTGFLAFAGTTAVLWFLLNPLFFKLALLGGAVGRYFYLSKTSE